jgi:hypothetical protein
MPERTVVRDGIEADAQRTRRLKLGHSPSKKIFERIAPALCSGFVGGDDSGALKFLGALVEFEEVEVGEDVGFEMGEAIGKEEVLGGDAGELGGLGIGDDAANDAVRGGVLWGEDDGEGELVWGGVLDVDLGAISVEHNGCAEIGLVVVDAAGHFDEFRARDIHLAVHEQGLQLFPGMNDIKSINYQVRPIHVSDLSVRKKVALKG